MRLNSRLATTMRPWLNFASAMWARSPAEDGLERGEPYGEVAGMNNRSRKHRIIYSPR